MNNAIPISIGQPSSADDNALRWLIETDHRRGSIGVHVATDPSQPARTSTSLWLGPDRAEALARAVLTAVAAWREHQATIAWTATTKHAGGRA